MTVLKVHCVGFLIIQSQISKIFVTWIWFYSTVNWKESGEKKTVHQTPKLDQKPGVIEKESLKIEQKKKYSI